MLKELTLNTTVYLVTGYSDLRKGIEGLAAVVQGSLSLDPFNKGLYLFCGRRRDRIKGLIWEGDGFLLHRGYCIKTLRMKYGYLQAVTEMFAGNLQTFPFFCGIRFL